MDGLQTRTPSEYAAALRAGDAAALAQAITLVESSLPSHEAQAAEMMRLLLAGRRDSVRIGITGVPGVGKSTFIEAFGLHLCEHGHRVAVLAVDPTSVVSGGSILGDKTRMERLSRHPSAYIRPSPSGGVLGGVTRKTRETITLCEAAGYDVILVETVGVGQSEIAVRSMTDFYLLLVLTGAGDDLQGIKKGIVEMADAVAVTKADGDNIAAAERLRLELLQVMSLVAPATAGWKPPVVTCSATTNRGVPDIWTIIADFHTQMTASGEWEARRLAQLREGLVEFVLEQLLSDLSAKLKARRDFADLLANVAGGEKTLRDAARSVAGGFVFRAQA